MKSLYLYNTLNQKKEIFQPINKSDVRMYSCGPTVYNYIHIGNGRMAVVFDLLHAILVHLYGEENVRHVQNITDVDDKIIDASNLTGNSIDTITRKFTEAYLEDREALGCRPLTEQPKCRDFIPHMIEMITTLIDKGNAYVANGDVLFDVSSMPNYGQLSHKNLDDLIAGARIEVSAHKKNSMDFVLWKKKKESEPDEAAFNSPWGRGRPGWHIECSAMSAYHLGNTFDIHGGGQDLIFPHHENEIAQSCCAHGTQKMANYWVHNGFLTAKNEKMSKSLGNFSFVADLRKEFHGEVLRLALLTAHYRQPLNFDPDLLYNSYSTLRTWYAKISEVPIIESPELDEEFIGALLEDMNTPLALAKLHGLFSKDMPSFIRSARFLGLLKSTPESFLNWLPESAPKLSYIQERIYAREKSKASKDYKTADLIRDELKSQGIELEDSARSTGWYLGKSTNTTSDQSL